jgi:hypothetical protein
VLDVRNAAGETPLALTLPRSRPDGRPQPASGNAAAEELLRKLGAMQ